MKEVRASYADMTDTELADWKANLAKRNVSTKKMEDFFKGIGALGEIALVAFAVTGLVFLLIFISTGIVDILR